MTREEKILLAIEKGFTCNPKTGEIFGISGNELKSVSVQGYRMITFRYNDGCVNIRAHQFMWYWVHKEVVDCIDHINRIKTDNRIENLRSVTLSENQHNRNGKGYTWCNKSQQWKATIGFSNKRKYLGMFDNKDDARQAYLDAKEIYHKKAE
jgi:hypothetical protein